MVPTNSPSFRRYQAPRRSGGCVPCARRGCAAQRCRTCAWRGAWKSAPNRSARQFPVHRGPPPRLLPPVPSSLVLFVRDAEQEAVPAAPGAAETSLRQPPVQPWHNNCPKLSRSRHCLAHPVSCTLLPIFTWSAISASVLLITLAIAVLVSLPFPGVASAERELSQSRQRAGALPRKGRRTALLQLLCDQVNKVALGSHFCPGLRSRACVPAHAGQWRSAPAGRQSAAAAVVATHLERAVEWMRSAAGAAAPPERKVDIVNTMRPACSSKDINQPAHGSVVCRELATLPLMHRFSGGHGSSRERNRDVPHGVA